MNTIVQLITTALETGPWAFIGVAALLIGLVLAGAYAYRMRERARARTITDTASAITPSGGLVIHKNGRRSLTVVLPVPRQSSHCVVQSHLRIPPIVGPLLPLETNAPHREIER